MKKELVTNKVYYKYFDKSFKKSSGIYNKFKDHDEKTMQEIHQNLYNVQQDLAVTDVFTIKQVHGNNIVILNENTDLNAQLEADAVVTMQNQIALAILTADCVPVLFSSEDGQVIAAAHCGWRSARMDIIEKVKSQMDQLIKQQIIPSHRLNVTRRDGATPIIIGERRATKLDLKMGLGIKAVIGPAIQQKSYEIDESFYQNFLAESQENKQFFIHSNRISHYMFDLVAYVRYKLEASGILINEICQDDTYAMAEKYPSFRRCTHNNNEKYNSNILSAIYKHNFE